MKYKLYALAACLLFLGSMALLSIPQARSEPRVHQHLEQQKKPACTHEDGSFCTHLPIISINTGGQQPPLEWTTGEDQMPHMQSAFVPATVTVYDSTATNNHPTDAPSMRSQARVRYRGNSSIRFDKKSYKINLVDDAGAAVKDHELLGMPAHDQWVLGGPFLDKTLLRNYLCLNISGEIMDDAPEVRFCELFENGTYRGVYLATESIDRDEERVDITSYSPGDPYTSYLLRQDRSFGQPTQIEPFADYAIKFPQNIGIEVLYPSEADLTPELMQYIKNDFSAFEKALYSFDYNTSDYGYAAYIDVDSFVDYFVINEFFQNYDAGLYSTYYYKDIRGKIQIGPVWDFNNCADNFMDNAVSTSGFEMIYRPHYFMLVKDQHFIERVIARYRQLRKTVLSDQYVMDYIEQSQAFLGGAVARNYEVWGYSFDAAALDEENRLSPPERNPGSYAAAIAQLKDTLHERGAWLDQNIDLLLQYCHSSKVKKFTH